ncbi:BlaI/MecI/CopY family transcriptional regulator [Streptomyces sp. NPDC021356]|uniref:BlaI/MecI/CopY family transcriptional regulator n=1 Tax=Streptomyces sp. NPDC021356 TaxID=3154900 RepID=UPI0033E6025E
MPESTASADLASQYTAQVTGDLERNLKEQDRVSSEIASLQEQLTVLRRDHDVLVNMQQALGLKAAASVAAQSAPAAAPSKSASTSTSTGTSTGTVPAPRRKGTAKTGTAKTSTAKSGATKTATAKTATTKTGSAKPATAQVAEAKTETAKPATDKSSASKSTAAKPTTGKSAAAKKATAAAGAASKKTAAAEKPAAAKPAAKSTAAKATTTKTATAKSTTTKSTAAKSADQPTLVELVRRHLVEQNGPRSAAEVTTALGQAHPDRGVKTTVVRTTLEGLVAKNHAHRTKQGTSVFYTANEAAEQAPAVKAQTEAQAQPEPAKA